ncbi:hypothetical protein CHH75_06465 [Paenibacillus sp. 7541]|nr:hypothetical protein CHH75_06465 [Paenibacillus sp. 7541]
MKVLLVTIFLIPYVGGVWKYMQQVKQGLEADGHEVDMIGDGIDGFYVYGGGEHRKVLKSHFRPMLQHKLNPASASPITADPWVRDAEVERLTLELSLSYLGLEQYDIIHAQDVLAASAVSRVKPAQTPLVTSIHASVALTIRDVLQADPKYADPLNSLVWKYYKTIEYIGGNASDHVLLASRWLRDVMVQQFDIPGNGISLIPYAMDIPAFEHRLNAEHRLQRPTDRKVLISTSRLSPEKGVHVLIEALGQLHKQRQDWECWLVGDGDKRPEYEQLVHKLGIQSSVHFWGTREDVPSLLTLADIFVMPSMMETLSYSVMEAQLAGLPIVSSDAGGLKEAVRHEDNGLLFPAGDAGKLAESLALLLADETYRNRLGKRARKWALVHRDLETMIKRLLQVYRRELKRKQA